MWTKNFKKHVKYAVFSKKSPLTCLRCCSDAAILTFFNAQTCLATCCLMALGFSRDYWIANLIKDINNPQTL